MSSFTDGFEKRAVATGSTLIGKTKGLRSGLRKYQQGGVISKPMEAKPGVSVAPRFDPVPLPSNQPHSSESTMKPKLPGVGE